MDLDNLGDNASDLDLGEESGAAPSLPRSPSLATPDPPVPGNGRDQPVSGQRALAGVTIAKIEDIIEGIVDSLAENRVLTIPIRSRRTGNDRLVRFPANTDAEAKKFASLLLVLHLSHQALVAGRNITKRDIYYQNPSLFGSQRYVDDLVDDIAFTFGTGRDALNIVATQKGLVAGKVTLTINEDRVLDCSLDLHGTLVPNTEGIRQVSMDDAQWILVIEKEATFRALVALRYFETSAAGSGVLITGKGYPDLATRQFLHFIHSACPLVTVCVLVDFDPDGIKIMQTYKHGSRGLAHESQVTLPKLSWIGLKSQDLHPKTVPSQMRSRAQADLAELPGPAAGERSVTQVEGQQTTLTSTASGGSILTLKAGDRKKAVGLLDGLDDGPAHDASEIEIRRELQIMILLNVKAEIQAVDDWGDLTAWLDARLVTEMGQGG
ncbi:Spo11/DNA topoisomerase VI subunit A [Xylariomycetidae sp. FL0641]|nr:Spo11/DNA topoisomerase VI subunit A [Xylariomycetidae sp. FL0641]